MSAKEKKRTRKPPRRLSAAEIAEINELIALRHWQNEQEGQNILRCDREELDELFRASPTTPWPKPVGPGSTASRRLWGKLTVGGDGFFYGREADGLPEAQRAQVVEIARHDGLIRYALAPGEPAIHLDQYWSKIDPSWQLIMTRTRGVQPNDWDRAVKAIIKELLKTGTPPLGPYTRAYLDAFCVELDPDPKRREHEQDRALTIVITGHLSWLVELLGDADFKGANKTRAAEYLAGHWRKIVQQDRGRSRFSSGPALTTWLRRHRDPTKTTPKMSCQRGRSEHSDES
jgi:hypothetical protein